MPGPVSSAPNDRFHAARRLGRVCASWIDSAAAARRLRAAHGEAPPDRVDWPRIVPFLALHAACLFVLVVGWSPVALAACAALYVTRMFAITAFYHRYFSHRAFRASRPVQLAMAVAGASAVQRGPLWWAAHHRKHHAHADGPADVHSPVQRGLLWSHAGWLTSPRNYPTDAAVVPDLARFAELRFLDRFDVLVPLALAAGTYALGAGLAAAAPGLGTSGPQMLVWGFVVSTVLLFHATSSINSLAHRFGSRAFETPDASRNNVWLALLTLGEGWHNNHHRYPHSARQGFRWWELDVSYLLLRAMAAVGLIRDLRPVAPDVLAARDAGTAAARGGRRAA